MTVLVTGAAGGIGSATASAFEASGADVLRHDIAAGARIDIVGDLMDPVTLDDIRAICESAKVDTVIAAHGAAGSGELTSIADARIRRIMQINALSVIRLFNALRDELASRSGVFVSVSSQAGLAGEAQNAVYSASKSALIGWTKAVASHPAMPRMRVVCPGMTETPLLVAGLTGMAADAGMTFDEFLARRLEQLPSRRLGRPSEVARSIVWLTQLQTRAAVVAAITGGETF